MAYTSHYGNIATTSNSDFYIVLYIEDPIYNASTYTLKYYWAIDVTRGNFQGSILDTSYSGEWSITLYGPNIVAKSDIYTVDVPYGQTKTLSGWASYTGGSGAFYQSSLTFTAEPSAVRIYDGSEWKKAIPLVYNGSEWKKAIPLVYNGSEWVSGPLL